MGNRYNVAVVTGQAAVNALNPFTKMDAKSYAFNGNPAVASALGLRMEIGNVGRKQGPHPYYVRLVKLSDTFGTITSSLVIPIATATKYNSLNIGSTVTYDGSDWTIEAKGEYKLN